MTVIRQWLAEPLGADAQSVIDRLQRSDSIDPIAVMPDVHLAGHFCVGVVVGSRSHLYPSAVGGDIGCGVATVCVHAEADRFDNQLAAAGGAAPLMTHTLQMWTDAP